MATNVELAALIASQLPDNTTGYITPARERSVLNSIIASFLNLNDVAGTVNNTDTKYFFQDDFILPFLPMQSTLSGTGADAAYFAVGQDSTENAVGVWGLATGTTPTGYAISANTGLVTALGNGNTVRIRFRARVNTLSDGSDTFTCYLGFIDNTGSGDNTDGIYFRYTHSVNSGKWEAVNADNGSRTAVDTTVAADTTFMIFEIEANEDLTSVSFTINGVTVANTSDIPSGTSRTHGLGFKIEKSAGSNDRYFTMDWYDVLITRTTAR